MTQTRNHKNMDKQGGTNTPPNRDVLAVQRVAKAVQLRAQKLTYEEIARRCGYSNASACRKAIMRELDRCVVKNIEQLRTEELAMLDQLHTICWERLEDEEHEKGMLFAVDRIVAISERRSKLMSLDMRPEEQLMQQNYTKRIVLVTNDGGGNNDASGH